MKIYLWGAFQNHIRDLELRIAAMSATIKDNHLWKDFCDANAADPDTGVMESESRCGAFATEMLHDLDLIYTNDFSWEKAKELKIVTLMAPEKEWNELRAAQRKLF